MLEFIQKRSWIKIIFGILVFGFGLTAAIMALTKCDENLIAKVLFIILAVFFFIDALLLIVFSIINSPTKMFPIEIVVAGILIALGIIFIWPGNAEELWQIGIKLILLIFATGGVISIIKSIVLIIKKATVSHWLPMMFFGLLFAAGGTLLLIFYKDVSGVINTIIGLILAVTGLAIIILGTVQAIKARKAKKAIHQN